MRFYSFIFVLFFTVLSNAQTKKGYYITDSGQRVEGFFKEANFLKTENPEFTTLPGGEYFKLLPTVVKEYGIDGDYKFESHTVKVDLSQSVSIKTYSTVRDPKWEKRTIFLNVITQGDAVLYSANVDQETKYFYSVKSKDIKPVQLVYKKYYNGKVIKENNDFRQELFVNVNCNSNADDFANIRYDRKPLAAVINKYNECNGTVSDFYDNSSQKKTSLKFTVSAGVNFNRFIVDADGITEQSTKAGPAIAAEAVFVMPYSQFGLFGYLDYTKVENDVTAGVDYTESIIRKNSIDASFVGFLIGPRFYINKQKAEKGLFFDAGMGLVFGSGKVKRTTYQIINNEEVETGTREYDVNSNIFFGVGAGYNISKKIGLDVRYQTDRQVVNNIGDFKFGKMGVNLRYTFN